jgi:hypothetical protein
MTMDFGSSAPTGIVLLGLLLGMRHATEPDHVIAVTVILSREQRLGAAARIGVVWGLGHTITVLAVGGAIIIFKLAIPVRLGLAMELAVAIALIVLGLGAVGALMRRIVSRLFGAPPSEIRAPAEAWPGDLTVHSHVHTHDRLTHRHPHVHRDAERELHQVHVLAPAAVAPPASRHPLLRSFGVGLVHGLAGSAAIALLVLSAIPEPLWATLYLAIFCAGTILGMGLVTSAIATPLILASRRMSALHEHLVISSGILSFGFGLFLAYRLGIAGGLFGAGPLQNLR